VSLRLPCLEMGCARCCRDTTMPISRDEAARLARRTGMAIEDFAWENEQGVLTLLNDSDTRACVFLVTESAAKDAPGLCAVHEDRPEGCRHYPFVLNDNDVAVLDEGCPFPEAFGLPGPEEAAALLNLEERMLRGG